MIRVAALDAAGIELCALRISARRIEPVASRPGYYRVRLSPREATRLCKGAVLSMADPFTDVGIVRLMNDAGNLFFKL